MWKNFGLPVTDEAEIGSKLMDGRKMARFDVLGGSIGINVYKGRRRICEVSQDCVWVVHVG